VTRGWRAAFGKEEVWSLVDVHRTSSQWNPMDLQGRIAEENQDRHKDRSASGESPQWELFNLRKGRVIRQTSDTEDKGIYFQIRWQL
jgi:hypothetical protein